MWSAGRRLISITKQGYHNFQPLRHENNLFFNTQKRINFNFQFLTKRSTQTVATQAIQGESKTIKWWITGCTVMVYGIIVVGGITRLTESGLSMVDWKLHGSLPPMNEEEWETEFNKYKQFPEFKKLFPRMTVDEFKNIFFWEYTHRMWGRAIGLAVGIPFLYFSLTKKIQGPLLRRSALLLGGVIFQGLLGWWMVKSGLQEPEKATDPPRVSQYRLTAHLTAAVGLYSVMLWTTLDLWKSKIPTIEFPSKAFLTSFKSLKRNAHILSILVFTTTMSGALVAGLDAGLAYNMFPFMEEGRIKAENAWSLSRIQYFHNLTAWFKDNLFDNTASVQFNHRVLAVTTATFVSALYISSRKLANYLPKSARFARHALMGAVVIQVSLGISTLLYLVPVSLAACHQAGAIAVLSSALWFLHSLSRVRIVL